jgi:hypothetical protein
MDRQKLSKVVFDQLRERQQENRGWQYEAKLRLSHAWGRFGALSVWEKSIIAGASLLFVMAVPAVIVAFSSGGGSDDSSVTAPRSTVDRSSTPFPTATPYPRTNATPRPIAVGGPPPVPPAPPPSSEPINRQDCDAIKGTPYQSEEERIWYLNNHCDDVQEDGGSPTEPPPQPPTQPPATQPPPPDQGLTASQAISLGAQFLGASSGSCSASDNGTYWRVSCLMAGKTAVACVFEQPVLVDYC